MPAAEVGGKAAGLAGNAIGLGIVGAATVVDLTRPLKFVGYWRVFVAVLSDAAAAGDADIGPCILQYGEYASLRKHALWLMSMDADKQLNSNKYR